MVETSSASIHGTGRWCSVVITFAELFVGLRVKIR
jgi:hypothetical protein